jgi:hypothetical protein
MGHRSRLGSVIIDCRGDDPDAAARFWTAALGCAASPGGPTYRRLGVQPSVTVEVQAVDHDSRVHLDIQTDDIPAEVARLERLGARRVAEIDSWVVMQAPTGQRFCVVREQTADFAATANRWEDAP